MSSLKKQLGRSLYKLEYTWKKRSRTIYNMNDSVLLLYPFISLSFDVNQGLIKPLGCLIGRLPLKYQIMTIGGILPLIFINNGLFIWGWHHNIVLSSFIKLTILTFSPWISINCSIISIHRRGDAGAATMEPRVEKGAGKHGSIRYG